MMTLLQLISRMIDLEYTPEEIAEALYGVRSGEITYDELFFALALEIPNDCIIDRFKEILNDDRKFKSGLTVGLMRGNDE